MMEIIPCNDYARAVEEAVSAVQGAAFRPNAVALDGAGGGAVGNEKLNNTCAPSVAAAAAAVV